MGGSTDYAAAFVTVTRLAGLSLVLLAINIADAVHHGGTAVNALAAVAQVTSLLFGVPTAIDRVLRSMVVSLGFVMLEWFLLLELLIVSGLCTAIAVITDMNGTEAESVSVAMALVTALLIRVDLTLPARIASSYYMETLMKAASDDAMAASLSDNAAGSTRLESSRVNKAPSLQQSQSASIFVGEDIDDIAPPHLSLASVAVVHLLAAIALPMPLVGAFTSISDPDSIVVGHLVAVLLLAWIRVSHSFVVARAQVQVIQSSCIEDETELSDLAAAMANAETTNDPSLTATGGFVTTTGLTEPFGDDTATSLSRHGSTLGATGTLHQLSTTQTFRNRSLAALNKAKVTEVVRENKPKYRIGTVLGRGGFSTVYAAMNTKTGELMAAKKLSFPGDSDESEQRMQLLQNEVAMMRALDHPHVVKYLFCDQPPPKDDVDDDLVEFLIFMEYVGGGSLQELVKNFGALTEEATASFAVQMLLGIEYLHASGRIHRDVKPGNVLCRVDGHAKISDFGTSLDFGSREGDEIVTGLHLSEMAGTPLYSPPELLKGTILASKKGAKKSASNPDDEEGATVDEAMAHGVAADVWGVGVTVMEMLTGERPWAHLNKHPLRSLREMMEQAAGIERALDDDEWETAGESSSSDARKVCPNLPPQLTEQARSFLAACLHIDPLARLNASALLCHPWIQQFDLIDTKSSPLHDWVPVAVEAGVIGGSSTRNSAAMQQSAMAAALAKLPSEHAAHLQAGLAAVAHQRRAASSRGVDGSSVATTAGGEGSPGPSNVMPLLTPSDFVLEPLPHDIAPRNVPLEEQQAKYVDEKNRRVRLNMNKLVHRTRALMRLGAFNNAADRDAQSAE